MASEVRLPEASVNDLYAAWARRRERLLEMDRAGVAAAEAEIERLRRVLGIREVPDLSWALLREAAETAELDREAALARAALAVRLSPDLPGPRFALARLRLAQAPGEVGAWAGEVWAGLKQVFSVDPVRRTAAGNLVLILLTGLLAAGVVFVLVTMGRVLRTFLHDLHHLLPRGSTRLQAGVLGVALLVAPFVLGLGLAFGVVVLAAAAWLYVGLRDRVVLALTLGIFAATPVVLDQVAAVAGFWNAPAGDLWLLENTARQEGPARRLEAWAKAHEGQVPWQIFHALGNWHLRSGRLDEAEAMFQRALSVEGRAAPSLVGLGIVRFARGDLPGAKESFKAAIAADPKHAPAYHNLAKVYFRMGELEPGQEARRRARELDRALVTAHPDEASELNVGLAGCPLPTPFPPALVVPEDAKDASALVDVRLSSIGPPDAAPLVPAGGLALLLLVGFVFGRLRPSKTCVKCGRSVCHRCDPDVGHGHLCGQCVNVFQKRGAVPPQVKVEKELRIRRYQALKDRIAAALSLVLPGAGQVASGRPVAGFLLLTVFLAAAAAFAAYFGPISDPLTVGARLPLARAVIGGGAGLVAYILAQWGIFRRNP
ncbi:MAG: tetratricopeptide repeat protein [Deltaproteobacteria bacterium]|nr:MAG: tetratricopeptide repeat protein [Deltaproteobacteria bacterium]